jgi:LacI family transcriptional regulator
MYNDICMRWYQDMRQPLRIMVLIDSSRAFSRNLLRGVWRYANLFGPWEMYRVPPFYRDPFGKETALTMIDDWNADGLIIRENQGFKDRIPKHIPTVVSSASEEFIPGCGHIIGDHEGIGRMGAEHLMDRGFKNFGYCGFDDVFWSRLRQKGFCNYLQDKKYNINVYTQPPLPPNLLWEKEQRYILQWLETLPLPIGIMACADERSEHILQACKTAGLKIPDEVAIVGADDDEMICNLCYPTLSSVAFNTEQVGFEAAALLEKMIRGDPPQEEKEIILKPTYVHIRQSTDVMAVDDFIVAKALNFIKSNSHRQLSVDTVTNNLNISRRKLERKIKHSLNSSIYKQIVKYRAQKVEQLLIETDLTLSQIAFKLEFTNHQQIDRYFRCYKGITPSEFRKQLVQEGK